MKSTSYDARGGGTAADITAWLREEQGTNDEQLGRLKRNLRRAVAEELTPRQQTMVLLYYGRQMTMPAIARELGVSPSTVSRTLYRARRRLYRCLRFGL